MWIIVGLIAGAFAGTLLRGEGELFGALAGAIVGYLFWRQAKTGKDDPRIPLLEDAVRQLNARLRSIEQTGVAAPAAIPEATPEAPAWETPATVATPEPETFSPETVADSRYPEMMPPEPAPAPAAAVAHEPAAPREPSALWKFFFGGNTLVRVGILVLFFGVAFLLKYASDQGLVPIELRLAGVALGGVALLVLGWRLRHQREGFALMLQGGGIGILYLTVFAAMKLYELVPAGLAFALLAGMAFFSALLAVVQDSKALAITGAAGGFLAPILVSTGDGSHVALFSYYAVLNAGILFIAWHKAWRELNLVGFAFTALIGMAWGVRRYHADDFATTEPFLILFFLMYVAIAVLFALRQAPKLTHYVDGTIVFGVPLVAFGLQAAMLKDTEFGNAFSALALAAFYFVLAMVLYAKKRDSLRLLVESFLALGIGFATLAVPLALDARWTSAVWAVEGAAIVWIGVRQGRRLARAFGMLLQLAAGFAFLLKFNPGTRPEHLVPFLNSEYLGFAMISAAGLFINAYASRGLTKVAKSEWLAIQGLFIWGALWWFGGGFIEIERVFRQNAGWSVDLIFIAASCAAFAGLWQRLAWPMARYAALALAPMMALTLAGMMFDGPAHPFAHYGAVAWLAAFAAHLWVLRLHREPAFEGAGWLEVWHAAGLWLLAIVASWEVGWQIRQYVSDEAVFGGRVWALIAWALVPGALIAAFATRGARLVAAQRWPVGVHARGYLYLGALPLAVFLLLWIVFANVISNGNPAPLPYVPLLNPLDSAQFGALLALAIWYLNVQRMAIPGTTLPSTKTALIVLGIVVFIALNGVLLRTLHHYAGVPFRLDRMLDSNLVQAAFSLFWSLLALGAMFFANKRGLRALWFVGAALLAVVIAKLALVDLSNTGTVERIVSFIGVGLFCVVIGYFAPVPPKAKPEAGPGNDTEAKAAEGV